MLMMQSPLPAPTGANILWPQRVARLVRCHPLIAFLVIFNTSVRP
jgi:hypothetical protein